MLVPANAGGLRGKQYAILCTKCSVGIWAVDVEKFAVLCVEGCELKEIGSSKFQRSSKEVPKLCLEAIKFP